MELFYTVVSKEEATQSKPSLSLGGFKSASKVPNGSLGALFDEVSPYGLQNPVPEYVGLILQNTLSRSVQNLKLWMNVPEKALCQFKLAVVELTSDGQMEIVPSINSKPLYAEFYSTNPEDTIQLEGSFNPGEMLGLWIERVVNKESEEFLKRNNCDYLYELFQKNSTLPNEEEVELKIQFEYGN